MALSRKLMRASKLIMFDPKTWIIFIIFLVTYAGNLFRKHLVKDDDVLPSRYQEFFISRTWNDEPVNHAEIMVKLSPHENGVKIEVEAPFFGDPPPPKGGKPGEPFNGLWEYEVVEAFFLAEGNKYLEIELAPSGEHLILMLNGVRNVFKTELPLESYSARQLSKSWLGYAIIPAEYFPPKVIQFNAYAIHGSGDNRVYEALYPVPSRKYEQPDFHRLDYFKAIPEFKTMLPQNWADNYHSSFWENADV